MMKSSPKNSKKEEMALLADLSTSLDTYNGAPVSQTVARLHKKWLKPTKKSSPGTTSANSTTNVLVVKTLVKGIVKACIQEKVATKNEKKSIGVIDSLVEEYRSKYPTLTKQMVTDAIARYKKSQQNASDDKKAQQNASDDKKSPQNASDDRKSPQNASDESEGGEGAEDDDDDDIKMGRCIEIVEEEMAEYHEKIEALKRRRKLAASQPEPPTPRKKYQKKQRKSKANDDGSASKPPKKPRGSPDMHSPEENALINAISERYAKEREKLDRLPNGLFETIVDETKKDFSMEDFDLSVANIRKRVTWKFMQRSVDGDNSERTKRKEVIEEVFRRFSRAKESNGGKLPPGTLDNLVEMVKFEYGVPDISYSKGTLETKIRTRFKKENPEFQSNPAGVLEISKLSEEDKRKRQQLMNEVTTRYVRRKEEGPKKLPDGELDRIITQTKDDLGIHCFDVPKASIRGRINRKSLTVMTLGDYSPYDAIDEPLVATINNMLSQGISVTRAQGLEFANSLLKGKKMGDSAEGFANTLLKGKKMGDSAEEKDDGKEIDDGREIMVDAKWWRNFLERNKKNLVCASG